MKKSSEFYIQRALELAKQGWGTTNPNPMVGAVIVNNDQIVGEGYHEKVGMPHAEIMALKDAGKKAAGADLYVTLEPCSTHGRTPPCTEAIIRAKIKRVFIGVLDPNPVHAGASIAILNKAGIDVFIGICEDECKKLNETFFHWITHKMPFVVLKMAMTLDGKIADYQDRSQWITSADARERVQMLRMRADAIMVGGQTARSDHPSLLVKSQWVRQPRRFVATHMSEKELASYVTGEPHAERFSLENRESVLAQLKKMGKESVTMLLVEGGGELADVLLRWGVVHKIEFHVAPTILGGKDSKPVVGGAHLRTLPEAISIKNLSVKPLGVDLLIEGYVEVNYLI